MRWGNVYWVDGLRAYHGSPFLTGAGSKSDEKVRSNNPSMLDKASTFAFSETGQRIIDNFRAAEAG
jgi:hypothetical protein